MPETDSDTEFWFTYMTDILDPLCVQIPTLHNGTFFYEVLICLGTKFPSEKSGNKIPVRQVWKQNFR